MLVQEMRDVGAEVSTGAKQAHVNAEAAYLSWQLIHKSIARLTLIDLFK